MVTMIVYQGQGPGVTTVVCSYINIEVSQVYQKFQTSKEKIHRKLNYFDMYSIFKESI